jgi:putative membrane protein
MAGACPDAMGITEELAKERNRAAAERTLMAWIRTSLSLISFGFGLDKIIGAIRASAVGGHAHAQLSVRLVAVAFVLTGILALVAATLQHRRVLRRLRRSDYTYSEEPSIAQATAVLLTLIGLITLALLVAGALVT